MFDLTLALLLLLPLGIVCLFVAPWILLSSPGPVFYVAERLGRDGKVFPMYKFRSMVHNAPDLRLEDGSTYNAADDPRLTPVGRFLRRSSIDELPQVLNVLLGHMSLVGPRPDLPSQLSLYTGEEREKLSVRPGITGYSQANFRNAIPWKERLKHDVYYARHLSFRMDVQILFKTAVTVFRQRNVFAAAEGKIREQAARRAEMRIGVCAVYRRQDRL